ncbi:hypothetical protein Scel_17890 [Streptomyces cellostaticus]|nr:hypothetical protein Scel_17890 [Streptomyces cellostaticus]
MTRIFDWPCGSRALVDHVQWRVREDAVGVHHGEPARGQEVEHQVLDEGQVGEAGLQAPADEGVLRLEEDVR